MFYRVVSLSAFPGPMIKKSLLLAAICALAGGCSTTKTTDATDTKKATKPAAREEYVQQTGLGSWVPRRVKKSETAAKDDAAARRTLEQMRTDQMMRSMPKDPGGE